MFMTPGKRLAQWLLLLNQESHLSYMKKEIKKILQTTDPYIAVLKNRLQKTLDTIIGENQSAVIIILTIILDTLSTIRGIIDALNKLKKYL